MDTPSSPAQPAQAAPTKKVTAIIAFAAAALLVVIGVGMFFGLTTQSDNPVGFGWYIFSFTMGLTMIVLPCTFPLAFVIVPLAMGKGPMKGLMIALAFATGVAVTLSMYGVLAALLGKTAVGALGADLEVVKNIMYFIAGIFAYLFALGELGFIKARMPTFSGNAPMIIQRQGPVLKALLLGLFLGNIGVGCPHPATPVILTRIAVSGDVFYGWLLFLVHALGRVIPLMFLAMLGILGVNGLKTLAAHREKIERATGWAMVFVAGFILTLGLFTHDWWVNSGQHTLLESVTQEARFTGVLRSNLNSTVTHTHGIEVGEGLFGWPLEWGNWFLVALWIIPFWMWYRRKKKAFCAMVDCTRHDEDMQILPGMHVLTTCKFDDEKLAQEEIKAEARAMPWRFWGLVTLSALLIVTFVYWLPARFVQHSMADGHMDMMGGSAAQPLRISLTTSPASLLPGEAAQLVFSLSDAAGGQLEKLQIEHERYFHMIVVSEDFKDFRHVHPEDFGKVTEAQLLTGKISIPFTFPRAGRYLVSVNGMYKNTAVSGHFFVVAGERGTAVITKDLSRIREFNGYTASLNTGGNISAGKETALQYTIQRGGSPVTDLRGYLGAPMHLAIMSADQSYFLHTHGEVHDATGAGMHEVTDSDRFGPIVEAHATFPGPGLYQVFGELRHNDTTILTSFMVEVEPGTAGAAMPAMGHNDSGGHTH